jgi:hypothetical protein
MLSLILLTGCAAPSYFMHRLTPVVSDGQEFELVEHLPSLVSVKTNWVTLMVFEVRG